MDSSIDNIDNVHQYRPADEVSPLHRSERDKERKFAKELKEKLEEELDKQKKRHQQDLVVLHEFDDEPDDSGKEPPDSADTSDRHEPVDESAPPDDHIDVKA